MRRIVIVFLVFAPFINLLAQDFFTPGSSINVDKNGINLKNLKEAVAAMQKPFSEIEIDELRVDLRKNNNLVDNKIILLKNKISSLYMDKQELIKLKDIKKLEEQIKAKEKSREQIKIQTENDLSNISFSGLFLVAMDCNWQDSKDELADQASSILAPKAIENLNGVFIESLTKVENAVVVSDHIRQKISGSMNVAKVQISKKVSNQVEYLYVAKITVSPLEQGAKISGDEKGSKKGAIVIDLLNDSNFESKLKSFGITPEEIKNVGIELGSSSEIIKTTNDNSTRRQKNIIQNGAANYSDITKEIEELKSQLYNRSNLLSKIINNKTGITYDKNNCNASVAKALDWFDSELEKLKNEMLTIKEKELVHSKFNVNVTAEGDPVEDISKTAISLLSQLKSYSKVEKFMSITEVANGVTTDYEQAQAKDIYREIDEVWLYPVAGGNDNFYLTVVTRWKVTGESPGLNNYSPVKNTFSNYTETHANLNIEMVAVEGGTFKMGCTSEQSNCEDDEDVHTVTLSDYYISKYEVTHEQYIIFLNEKGVNSSGSYGGEEWIDMDDEECAIGYSSGRFYFKGSSYVGSKLCPVIEVTWYGAKAFADWISSKTGKKYKLPTEAEWEYAARGGKNSRGYLYAGSNNIDAVAEYSGNNNSKTKPVGGKDPNELGLYDMTGNVWEWCSDVYADYPSGSVTNPEVTSEGFYRVLRGCSWRNIAKYCRVAKRGKNSPGYGSLNVGFRLALSSK